MGVMWSVLANSDGKIRQDFFITMLIHIIMSVLKKINDKSTVKKDLEYLILLHNAVCKAKIDHDRNNVQPAIELLQKLGCIERMMKRHKNILECGFHDRELIALLPANGIGNVSLFD